MAQQYIVRLRRGWKEDNVDDWARYESEPDHIKPLPGEIVLEYDHGVPRLKIGDGIHEFSELPYMSIDSFVLPTPISITIYANKWEKASDDRWSQKVTVDNAVITPNSKVDLQPSSDQLSIFYEKDLAFVAENEGGIVSVYCVGQRPLNDYTVQATITEVVEAMDKVIGNTTSTPNPRPDWEQDNPAKADYIQNKPTIITAEEVLQLIQENGGTGGGVQSDWNQTDNTQLDYIKNKPDNLVTSEVMNNAIQALSVQQIKMNGGQYDLLYASLKDGQQGALPISPTQIMQDFVPQRTIGGQILVPETPSADGHAVSKKYVDTNFVPCSGNSTIDGDLSITGDLHIAGTTYTEDTETIRVADNIIELNSDKTDFSAVLSGLAINANSQLTYGVMYDPKNDAVKLGEGITADGVFAFKDGEGAPLTVRDDAANIADGAIMIFDKSKNRIVDSGYTIDSFKQWVREYIESYMSTEIIVSNNASGGETLEINTDEYTEENGVLTIGG